MTRLSLARISYAGLLPPREKGHIRLWLRQEDKANLNAVELRTYKQAAKVLLALTQAQIDTGVREGRLFEVPCSGSYNAGHVGRQEGAQMFPWPNLSVQDREVEL